MSALQIDEHGRKVYKPDGKFLRGFMASDARVRVIRGPIRSGTSSACCHEIMRRAFEQEPGPDGARKTRWFVLRNSYPDLKRSTIKTWLDWFPEDVFGRFMWSVPYRHVIRPVFAPDVVAEVEFLALDKPDDVAKLKSTEWTGGWINELQFTDRAIFDEAESRCGQYPPLKDGGPTWTGLMADMNSPTEDHWLVAMTGEVAPPDDVDEEDMGQYRWPEGWEYFVQPSALIEERGSDGVTVTGYRLNPDAENLRWIPEINGQPYYLVTMRGKGRRWIESNLMNRITAPMRGKAVWGQFREETHVAKGDLRFNPNYPLLVGLDFGRRPAAVFGQQIGLRWVILDELCATDVGASQFAPMVRNYIAKRFPGLVGTLSPGIGHNSGEARVVFWGDPKGQDKVQSDEQTAYDIWAIHGMRVRPAPVKGNNIETRIEAVNGLLGRMTDGQPGILISQRCRKLKMAMAGGYHFQDQSVKTGLYVPEKDHYADIADALQYLVIGGGEADFLVGRGREGAGRAVQTRVPRRGLRRIG